MGKKKVFHAQSLGKFDSLFNYEINFKLDHFALLWKIFN